MVNTLSIVEPENLIPARYKIECFLGSGGYGRVYGAFDSMLLRKVAIKIIKYEGPKALSEAQALARCSSPHIVEVYDVIHDDHHLAIVMEMVEALVELDTSTICVMDRGEFLDLFVQVLQAVSAIHTAGLLHLDLKPSNILFTQQGLVKVSDFGLSTRQKAYRESSNYSHSGSWECLSPEHLQQKPLSESTDIFALGTFLYTYAYKNHPFVAEGDIAKTQSNIKDVKFQFNSRQITDLPELEPLILAMLSKNPKSRPSVNQVMSAVENLRRNEGVPLETMELPPALLGGARKKIMLAGAVTLVVILLVAFVVNVKPIASTLVVPPIDVAGYAETDEESRKDYQLLSAIVEDEIVSSVINDRHRRLVSKKEWRGSERWDEEAAQADVDEIIVSKLDCRAEFCDLSLSIYSSKQQGFSHLTSKTIPSADLPVFSQVIEQSLITDLGMSSDKAMIVSEISDTDLRAYFDFKKRLENDEFVEEQLASLQQLSSDNPGFLGSHILLGEAYRVLYRNSEVEKWLQKSQELVLALSKTFPSHPSVMYLSFRNQILAKDHEAAETTLTQLKRVVGIESTQLVLLEAMLAFEKDPAKGYQKLIEHKEPRLTNAYFHHRAHMEDMLNKHAELEITCQRWSERFPDAYLPKFFLAKSYLTVGRLTQAEVLYLEILKIKKDRGIFLNLGIVQLLLGKYKASVENFENAMNLSPDSRQIYLNLAEAYKALGDDKADELFQLALTLYEESDDELARSHQALVLAHLGRFDEAIIQLQRAAQLNNKAGEFLFIAAQVHQLLGQHEAAYYNASEAVKKGFGPHWFRLPWMNSLYQRLQADDAT